MDFFTSKMARTPDCSILEKSSKSLESNEERSLLNKLTSMLTGIPPPPSIATSKLSCSQMLESIKMNIEILALKNVESPNSECNPRVFYVNKDILSEEIADLTMKLQARFVQSETASSYSIQANIDRQLSNSARKRRLWNGISPGRRLSHLAKRRQMFSKANLQQLSKNEQKVHKISLSKPTAQRNLAKEYLEYKDNSSKDRSLPKRALFQSPEDDILPGFRTVARNVAKRKLFAKPERSAQLPVGGGSYDVSSWLATQPFMGGKKRSRDESRDSDRKRRCPRRSLDFSDGSPSQCSDASALSNGIYQAPPPAIPLTQVQKQKLLWAVAVVLKERKITHKDSRFKKCATTLFTICKKNLSTIQSLSITGGTSEKMLTYARSKVDNVIRDSEPIPTTSKAPGILHDLSSSTLNKKQNDSQGSNKMDGKENVSKTPKRRKKVRHWQTCIKSNNRRKSRLNKSLSFDDLREINEKQLNLNLNEPVLKFSVSSHLKIKTPAKRKHGEAFNLTNSSINNDCQDDVLKESVILETPDKYQNNSDCIPGSQEEIESHNFPALARKQSIEDKSFSIRSPDLFDNDDNPDISQQKTDSEINVFNVGLDVDEDLNCSVALKENCLDISAVLLENNSLPIELTDCAENDKFSVDVVLINNELLSSAVDTPGRSGHASFLECDSFLVDKKCTEDPSLVTSPENKVNLDESRISIFNDTNQEPDVNELPKLFTEVALNENNLSLVQLENDVAPHMGTSEPDICIEQEEKSDLTNHSDNPIGICNVSMSNEKSSENVNVTHTSDESCKNISLLSEKRDLSLKSDVESNDSSYTGNESSPTPTETKDATGYCILNDTKAEFSIIHKSNEGNYVDIMGDDDDKPSSNVCTSTPLVGFSKKLMIKSKPAWRLEAGPGLKIRMRLSKDWDIVGRRDSHLSDSSEAVSYENNIDVDIETKAAKTQVDNSLIRKICNGESSGTSMDSYTLTEMRDRLAIEKTLADDNSDLSLFNSDTSSEVSSCSEKNGSCENSELLRNQNSVTENSNYNQDTEKIHQSFENMVECAMLEKKQDISASKQSNISTDARRDSIFEKLNYIPSHLEFNGPAILDTLPTQIYSKMCSELEITATDDKIDSVNDFNDDNIHDDMCQTESQVDEDDVPLIKRVLETSITTINSDMSGNVDNISNNGDTPFDDDDVPLIQYVSELSRCAIPDLNEVKSDDKKGDILRMSLDENVPLIKFVSELSKSAISNLNPLESNTANDNLRMSLDENVPLIKFVSESSKSAISDSNPLESNTSNDNLRMSLDENVPLIKFVSELSKSAISDLNSLESKSANDNLRMSLDENVPLIKFVSESSKSAIPDLDLLKSDTTDNLRISLDENVPLIQFVSESSKSAILDLNQYKSDTADDSLPLSLDENVPLIKFVSESSRSSLDKSKPDICSNVYTKEFGNKKRDDLRVSLDENTPLIKLIQESKTRLTHLLQEPTINKINVIRPSIEDDLPLKYLVLESSKENYTTHEIEPVFQESHSTEIDSSSDDDRPLMTSDRPTSTNSKCILDDSDDLPLCQLADNSCASKISKFNQCNDDDDNLQLIQPKNENCNFDNNNENYDPTKKYDLLLNQLNPSVENNDESNLIGINNSIASSEAEDMPLSHLIDPNSNENLASDDFEKLTSQEKNTTLELSALKSPTCNVVEIIKTSENEVRHFKEISVIKNKIESNCDEKLEHTNTVELENNYHTPSRTSIVSESTTDSRLIPMSAGSDTSTGKSRTKLSFESYKARKKLVLEPNNDGISPPKKIYNIRLKKKERHHKKAERRRSSVLESSNEKWDDECRDDSDNIDKLFIDKAKTFVNAFSTISCMVDQEMKLTVSAIADDKERERKLRKLSNVSEMSDNILQAFFDQIPNAKSIFTSES